MAPPEVTGRRVGNRPQGGKGQIRARDGPRADPDVLWSIRDPTLPVDCYSVREFCRAHRLSERYYRDLRAEGKGPDEIRLGPTKILISKEAAARWRAEREAATKVEGTTA